MEHMAEGDIMLIFEEVVKKVRNDPHTRKLAEEYHGRYGALTEEDLKKTFSI